jgi:hypothetical protein
MNVAEVLERVPGTIDFPSGWINSQKFIAVKLEISMRACFYDGIELDNLSARSAPLLDLHSVQLGRSRVFQWNGRHEMRLRTSEAGRLSGHTVHSRRCFYRRRRHEHLSRVLRESDFANGGGLQFAGSSSTLLAEIRRRGVTRFQFSPASGIARKIWSVDGFLNRLK